MKIWYIIKILSCIFNLSFCVLVKSNFIADWVLGFLLFAFSDSLWQTGTGSDSFFESSSADFHKTETMLTGCFFAPLHSLTFEYMYFIFVCLYLPNKGFLYKHNFPNFFLSNPKLPNVETFLWMSAL